MTTSVVFNDLVKGLFFYYYFLGAGEEGGCVRKERKKIWQAASEQGLSKLECTKLIQLLLIWILKAVLPYSKYLRDSLSQGISRRDLLGGEYSCFADKCKLGLQMSLNEMNHILRRCFHPSKGKITKGRVRSLGLGLLLWVRVQSHGS